MLCFAHLAHSCFQFVTVDALGILLTFEHMPHRACKDHSCTDIVQSLTAANLIYSSCTRGNTTVYVVYCTNVDSTYLLILHFLLTSQQLPVIYRSGVIYLRVISQVAHTLLLANLIINHARPCYISGTHTDIHMFMLSRGQTMHRMSGVCVVSLSN